MTVIIEQDQIDKVLASLADMKKGMEAAYWNEFLDRKGVAADWGVCKSIVDNACVRKKNPLPLKGKLDRITRQAAREWRDKYLQDYNSAHE